MVKPELGTKRVCPSCAIKFYDLLKDPIECPACSATFVADPILPSKNDAPPPAEPEKAADKDDDDWNIYWATVWTVRNLFNPKSGRGGVIQG